MLFTDSLKNPLVCLWANFFIASRCKRDQPIAGSAAPVAPVPEVLKIDVVEGDTPTQQGFPQGPWIRHEPHLPVLTERSFIK